MIGPVDSGLFAVFCIGFLAALFLWGVYGWMRAAAQADEMAWDDERRWIHELERLP